MTIELPPAAVHFVNRDAEKAVVRREFEGRGDRGRPLVIALSGPAGAGSTELANEVARGIGAGFADVLCVDLDEFRTQGPADTADALTQLLISLGVEPAFVKGSFKARCTQYWSVTARREIVLVVDNARYAAEVEPLVPASGGSVVIVTSRSPLPGLEDGTALELPLAPLDEAASLDLLGRIAGPERLAADPEAARAAAALCAGLPAALRTAGAWIRSHPLRPLPRLLDELRARIGTDVIPVVEQVWDAALDELPPSAGLLYRLLGEHPGPAFTRASATALLGLGPDACDDALEQLAAAGLADLRGAFDDRGARVRLPELRRAHARRRARQDLRAEEVAAAQVRVLTWITRQGQRADRFAAGDRLIVAAPVDPVEGAPDLPLPDPEQAAGEERTARRTRAARWLRDERHTLLACVRLAHDRELDALTVALCETVWTLALDHPRQPGVTEAFRLGRDSAVRSGDVPAMVRMRCQLARRLWESGDNDAAAAEIRGAFAGLELLGEEHTKLRASAVEFRGMLASVTGDWAAAAADFARSRDLHLSIGNAYGALLQTYRLGQAQSELGDQEAALTLLADAHNTATAMERERITARIALALGRVLAAVDRRREAARLYREALESARRRGSGFEEARVLDALAALESAHDPEQAATYAAAAAAIRERNGVE